MRLARRYLGRNGKDAGSAIDWIEDNRKWLFFSDTGGYRWFVDTNAKQNASGIDEASVSRRKASPGTRRQ